MYRYIYIYLYLVFTTEGLFEVAIESWPMWHIFFSICINSLRLKQTWGLMKAVALMKYDTEQMMKLE